MEAVTRRRFIETVAVLGAATVASSRTVGAEPASGFRGSLCFFSKHLPRMDAPTLGRTLKSLGFDGVDLTVRPKGHIEPARVAADLPPFVAAVRKEGIAVPMITTELLSDADPAARPTLETAAKLDIPFYKPGYYRYKFVDVRKELDASVKQLRGLAALSAQCRMRLGYHNHAGYVGGPVWDIAPAIDALDPKWAGYYYDVRHSMAEGGDAGWKTAFQLVAPRLLMIAVKDFYWEKTPQGWRQRHCPLGEGMVDWKAYFRMLAAAKFQGPVSLHLEYENPGDTPEAVERSTIAATAKDLAFLKAGLAEAYAATGATA